MRLVVRILEVNNDMITLLYDQGRSGDRGLLTWETEGPLLHLHPRRNLRLDLVNLDGEFTPFAGGSLHRQRVVVLDTHGGPDNTELLEFARTADLTLLPTTPDINGLDGAAQTAEILRSGGVSPRSYMALITMVRPGGMKKIEARRGLKEQNVPVMTATVRISEAFRDATNAAVLVKDLRTDIAGKCWRDYEAVAGEVLAAPWGGRDTASPSPSDDVSGSWGTPDAAAGAAGPTRRFFMATEWLRRVLCRYGWPSANRSDPELTFNASLLALHADRTPALQECVLDLTEQQRSTPLEHMRVVATRSPTGDLVIIATDFAVWETWKLYKLRWTIECTFSSQKMRGFDLERTGVKDKKRLERLFGLVTLAWLNCLRVGVWRHEIKPIPILAHGRRAMSQVRYGSELLRNTLRWVPHQLNEILEVLIRPFPSLG
ncbi:Transposase DDE domain-containing protein [Deinococcus hopiensis KR-140]|uniref:Transposase DDE domain-containing protein n=1 Tax=Deinococcus hopiensis KR-140 TaxID=695939 RepID=A0A1W1UZ86_9DEIO|nr:Transposase DDE domain-containing protein [Deinococcus hopiensis KR-140]